MRAPTKKKIFLKIYVEFAHYGVMLFTRWEVRIREVLNIPPEAVGRERYTDRPRTDLGR